MNNLYDLRPRSAGRANPIRSPFSTGTVNSPATARAPRTDATAHSPSSHHVRSPAAAATAPAPFLHRNADVDGDSVCKSSIVPPLEEPLRFSPANPIVCDGSLSSVRLLSSRLAMHQSTRGWNRLQSLDYVQQCLTEQVLSVLGDTVFACSSGTELVNAVKAAFCPAASRHAIITFSQLHQQRMPFNEFLPVFTAAWSDYSTALSLDDSLRAPLLFDRLTKNLQLEVLDIARHDPNWAPTDWCDLLAKARDAETTLKSNQTANHRLQSAINTSKSTTNSNAKLVCNHCKRNGHVESTCYKLHPELQKSKPPVSFVAAANTAADSLPTCEVWLSNFADPSLSVSIHSSALLDTGSTVNFIHSSIARYFDAIDSSATVLGIGGPLSATKSVLLSLQVQNVTLHQVPFFVIDSLPSSFDVILGVSAMRETGFTLVSHTLSESNPLNESIACLTALDCNNDEQIEFHISDALTPNQQMQLRSLLDEFAECFSTSFVFDTNNLPPVSHRIELIDEKKQPPRVRVRPLSPPKKLILQDQLDDLLRRGLIRPSKSPYAAPVVLATKPDGSTRFCVDYRQLNANTKRDNYPLPRIQQLLENLAGKTYYSAMDLLSGFWQVPMFPDDIEKTAFITPFGLFEFVVMPFGLMNATATFQRLTDAVFAECHVEPYVDDLVTAHCDFESHISELRNILMQMRKYALKAKPNKCHFAERRIRCLGHELSSDGIQPRMDSVDAINAIRAPSNTSEVRSFLGLVGYYQKHIPNFATVTFPLRQLLGKEAKFEWSSECDKSFQQLKRILGSRPILSPPDYRHPFVLTTDACTKGLGAVLHQNVDGRDRVIAYASQSLKPAERNYSTTEQEALAIVWAFDKFREYLDGVPFQLETDHRALQYIFDQKKPANSRIARWQVILQGQNYSIKHRSGQSIPQADALSRLPTTTFNTEGGSYTDEWINDVQFSLLSIEDVRHAQWHDPDCMALAIDMESDHSSGFKYDSSGLIVRLHTNGHRIVIPASLRYAILKHAHETSGHLSVSKFLPILQRQCYWPRMKVDAQIVCNSCEICAKHNLPRKSYHNGLNCILAANPFEIAGADIVGPLPMSTNGYKYFIIFVDYFSNLLMAKCVERIDAKTIATTFQQLWLNRYGAPTIMICDGGSQFLSDDFRRFLTRKRIRLEPTTFYHQQANGKVERSIQTIKKMIAKQLDPDEFQSDWDIQLPLAIERYNNAVQVETRFTPAQLALNREPPSLLEFGSETQVPPLPNASVHEKRLEAARNNVCNAQARQKRNFDKRHEQLQLQVGQFVMVRRKQFDSENPKLAEQFHGPFRVAHILEHDTYQLEGFPSHVSIDRVKPYLTEAEAKTLTAGKRPIKCPNEAINCNNEEQESIPMVTDEDWVVDDVILVRPHIEL